MTSNLKEQYLHRNATVNSGVAVSLHSRLVIYPHNNDYTAAFIKKQFSKAIHSTTVYDVYSLSSALVKNMLKCATITQAAKLLQYHISQMNQPFEWKQFDSIILYHLKASEAMSLVNILRTAGAGTIEYHFQPDQLKTDIRMIFGKAVPLGLTEEDEEHDFEPLNNWLEKL